MYPRVATFGIDTTMVQSRNFSNLVLEISKATPQSIYFCNVHMLMLAQEDTGLSKAMQSTDIVFADGVPIAWLQARVSNKDACVIRGYEMVMAVCEQASRMHESVGFLGSTPDIMTNLVSALSKKFEGLHVAYQYCPPFTQGNIESTQSELVRINQSGIKWLFVGLGCPKQEKWIAKYKHELNCNILGVGAAFDWLSGKVKKPPSWMEKYALAWLYRLFQNPTKMWRRYFIYNSKFILKALPKLIRRK